MQETRPKGNSTDLHKVIESSLKEYKITGASVSIVSNSTDSVIYNYGYANKSLKAFVENSTIFRIGSMTKIFTATAIMQLAEQGKVDIEKTIQDYIPEFSIKTRFGDLPSAQVMNCLHFFYLLEIDP